MGQWAVMLEDTGEVLKGPYNYQQVIGTHPQSWLGCSQAKINGERAGPALIWEG